MATLNSTIGFSTQLGTGPVISDGSTAVPVAVTVNQLSGSFAGTVANATIAILWDTARAFTTTFTIGWVYVDQVCLMEFQTGGTASNSNLQLIPGIMMPIPGVGLAYSASGGFLGAVTNITQVRIKNTSGNVANVRGWFFLA